MLLGLLYNIIFYKHWNLGLSCNKREKNATNIDYKNCHSLTIHLSVHGWHPFPR